MSLAWITDAAVGPAPHIDPDKPALACGAEAPLTHRELRAAEMRFASALHRAGVVKGDRVGLLLRNSTDYVALYLAIARIGAISVRLNWRLTSAELAFVLGDSSPAVLVLDEEFAPAVETIRGQLGIGTHVVSGGAEPPTWAVSLDEFTAGEVRDLPGVATMDDPVSLMYTSGTTGRPKGAVWTHGNTLWFASIQAMKWKYDKTTVALTPGPLFHAGGLEAVFLPALLCHGLAVTYPSGGLTLDDVLAAAGRHEATNMLLYSFLTPEFSRLEGLRDLVPASMRQVNCGGDMIEPQVFEALKQRLPGVRFVQQFGLTEGGAISTCLDHEDTASRPRSVGRPMPLTEVKVTGSGGEPLPADEVGEIWVRSPAVSPGYWQRPEANAETFDDGWCRTGDLGSLDAHGFLSLRGRAKDMIRSGGENVYPAEVEAVIAGIPGVLNAALVGIPDARYGEVGRCYLELDPGASVSVEEIRAQCLSGLAKFKVPREFVVVASLPRTPTGKVQKYALRGTPDRGEPVAQPATGACDPVT
jgi:fatty-acyl-CoA synthase